MSARYLVCIKVSIHSSPAVSSSPSATFFPILTRAVSLLAVFYRAYQFDSDVSKWNVAKVSNMQSSKYSFLPPAASSSPSAAFFPILTRAFSLLAVFYYAEKFDSDVSKWDVAKVSNMYKRKYSLIPPLSRRRLPPHSFQT